MKKFKSGFTLAEVLITLGIIGVVAAIVMPTMMTNHTFRTTGVKLSKFTAQLEGASRPYVVSNTNITTAGDVANFATEAFLLKNNDDLFETVNCEDAANVDRCGNATGSSVRLLNDDLVLAQMPQNVRSARNLTEVSAGNNNTTVVLTLKDGTSLLLYMLPDYQEGEEINTFQVGQVAFGVAFNPNVQGLPSDVQQNYLFAVTELGYVYPDRVNDTCLAEIFDNDFVTNSTTFAEDGACDRTASQTPAGGGN